MVKSFCGLATAFLPVNTQLSWHKTKGMPRYVWDVEYVVIYNGNKTEWSPIRAVIIRVIKKFGRARSGSPICSSRVWLQTELTPGGRVNYNHFNFEKTNTPRTNISGGNNVFCLKFLHFGNSPVFLWISGFLLWLLWSFLWLVDELSGLSMIGCFNCPTTCFIMTVQNDYWKMKLRIIFEEFVMVMISPVIPFYRGRFSPCLDNCHMWQGHLSWCRKL